MNSHNIKKPNGGVTMRRVMEQPDPNENLLERVLSRDNVQKGWKRVKANKGVPGIDRMSIEDSPEFARAQSDNIRDSLMAGTYQPSPVKRVEIAKPTGGRRQLGIPTVLDRVIQQAMYQVMMPIFDPEDLHTMRSANCGSISAKGTASPWIWTYQSSSTGSTTTCSCIGWPRKSGTSVFFA